VGKIKRRPRPNQWAAVPNKLKEMKVTGYLHLGYQLLISVPELWPSNRPRPGHLSSLPIHLIRNDKPSRHVTKDSANLKGTDIYVEADMSKTPRNLITRRLSRDTAFTFSRAEGDIYTVDSRLSARALTALRLNRGNVFLKKKFYFP
jgi:hypothetical protein